jgi:hypothetical protein
MPISSYPKGFGAGVAIRGMPILNTYGGEVFWVDSGSGSNGNPGTFTQPFATIAYAVDRCTANAGDVIMVMPNHSESISTADIEIDVDGVSIIGLGNGDDRPTILYTGTTDTTTFDISSDGVYLENFLFSMTDNDAVDSCIVVNGKNVEIAKCEFVATSDDQFDTAITIGVADNDADKCFIHDCVFRSLSAGANSAILLAKDHAFVRITDNYIDGDFADAGISVPAAGNACTELLIARNYIRNRQTGDHAIEVTTGGTMSGMIIDNRLVADTITAILEPHTLMTLGNRAHLGGTNLDDFAIPLLNSAPQMVRKTIAAAGTSFTTGASPVTIFTVTGSVKARVYATVGTALASTLNNGTLAVGVSGNTGGLIAATTADGTNFAANTVWAGDTSPTVNGEVFSNAALNYAPITNGADIIVTVATNSMTAGTMEIYCEWIPLTAGASVVAA